MDEIEEYRQKNKERYNGTRDNTTINEGSRGTGSTTGSISQDVGGYSGGASRDQEGIGSGDRGFAAISSRTRQRRRRPFNDDSSATERNYQATGPVGLTRGVEIDQVAPPTVSTSKIHDTLDKIKEAMPTIKSKTLSNSEIKEYTERLPSLLQSYFEYLDKFNAWKTGKDEVEIWGNINDTEAKAFSDVLLRQGQRSKYAAETVRKLINGEDYITVSVMFVPRIIMTVEAMRDGNSNKRRNLQIKSTGRA